MSLRIKTIIGIAFIEALMLAVLIYSGLSWLKTSNEKQLQTSSQQLVSVFAKATQDAVLSSDLAYLDSFAEAIVSEHKLAYVRIIDRNSRELARHGQFEGVDTSAKPSESEDGVYDVSSDIMVNGLFFGSVEMGVRVDGLRTLLESATTLSLTLAGVELLLVALFSFALGTYLMKRLELLRKGVEEVGASGPGKQIEVKGNDEVASVSRAFNQMSLSLYEAQVSIEQEHKQKAVLSEQVTELAQVAEHARDAIIITNSEGQITWVNRSFELLSGYKMDDVIGKSPGRLLQGKQTDPRSIARLSEGIRCQQPVRVEILNYDRSGMPYWIDLDVSPVKDKETGEVQRFIAVQRDVTERRYVEQQLESALERATKATKAKSEFLANMSHEIRTPMNAIMGMSELLMEESQNEGQQEQLQIIHQSADNLVTIINDILDYSKIEAGKLTLRNEPFDLASILESSMALCAFHAEQKGIRLMMDMPSNTKTTVIGDKGRVNQILLNLIGNAVKFTNSGHIKLSLRSENFYQHTRFTIAVEDTGVGIPSHRLPYIMDKFEQVDNSATRQHQGTGLGLAICKRLVGLFGGHLTVSSQEGVGSTFTFTLELLRDEDNSMQASSSKHSGCKVLYIDDYEPQVETITRTMSDMGLDVIHVRTVEDALVALFEDMITVDFALIDVNASYAFDREKIAALKNLHQHIRQKALPVTIFSPNRIGKACDATVDELIMVNNPLTRGRLAKLLDEHMLEHGERTVDKLPEGCDGIELKPITILIAEDSPINRLLVEKMLANTPLKLLMAENGEEALALYERHKPDMVISDISMPKKDGYELTAAIRKKQLEAGWECCPVIALSAHAMKEEQQKSLLAGMDDYLTKPVRKVDLIAMINRWSSHDEAITPINQADSV